MKNKRGRPGDLIQQGRRETKGALDDGIIAKKSSICARVTKIAVVEKEGKKRDCASGGQETSVKGV